jgi:threonine dehydrogenase-like Zn-dependent dehydrogenase
MRAVVIAGPRRAEISEISIPEPAPDEVLVRLEGCGVSASNLPIWEGRERFGYPRVAGAPGREAWGRIEATGAAVKGFSPGDRVAMLSNHAFAEYDIANSNEVVRLPDSFTGKPFPGESLGCAMNVFRRSRIESGQNVAIIGAGFLGALLTQLAARAGARVIVVSRRPFALEMARRCGAAETIPMDDHWRIIEQVAELTGGEGCERVIEATGAQQALELATELTRERGWLVIGGYHQEGRRQVNMQLWNWRGLDVINAHERQSQTCVAGMQSAVDAVASGELDPAPLYTHRFRLDQLDQAMEMMRRRPDGFLKALITM